MASVTTSGPGQPDLPPDQPSLYTAIDKTSQLLYCNAAIEVDNFVIKANALVDLGAEINVISRRALPDNFTTRVKTEPWLVRGISGEAEPAEKFHASIRLGAIVFIDVEILVMDRPNTECAIGLLVLRHASVPRFTVDSGLNLPLYAFRIVARRL